MTTQTQNPAYRPALSLPSAEGDLPCVWALADTHLGTAIGRTMDRFGPHWHDHAARIAENASRVVRPHDILLLPGDLSWATKRRDAEPDLALLAALPGIKVVIKGNHDHWWPSKKPLAYPGLHTPPFRVGDIGIAGTRGWFVPPAQSATEAADQAVLERERARLAASLSVIDGCPTRIVMLHYPPHPFIDELVAAHVDAVVYGHLHLGSLPEDEAMYLDGERLGGIPCFCVAADRIDFTPKRIL